MAFNFSKFKTIDQSEKVKDFYNQICCKLAKQLLSSNESVRNNVIEIFSSKILILTSPILTYISKVLSGGEGKVQANNKLDLIKLLDALPFQENCFPDFIDVTCKYLCSENIQANAEQVCEILRKWVRARYAYRLSLDYEWIANEEKPTAILACDKLSKLKLYEVFISQHGISTKPTKSSPPQFLPECKNADQIYESMVNLLLNLPDSSEHLAKFVT